MRNITANLLLSERFSFYLFVFQSRLESVAAAAACTLERTWPFPDLCVISELTDSICSRSSKRGWVHEGKCMMKAPSADTCTSSLLFADLCSMAWVHPASQNQIIHCRRRNMACTEIFGDQRGTVSSVSFGEHKVDMQIN